MAAACEDALFEVEQAIAVQLDPERTHALQAAGSLLKRELRRSDRVGTWVRNLRLEVIARAAVI